MVKRPAPASAAKADAGGAVLALVVIAVILVLSLSKCSASPDSATNTAETHNAVSQSLNAAVAAQQVPPVEALSRSAISRGLSHLRLAVAAEGLSGAMIYSQNCYDALSRKFTWAKLDTCGAFDAQASADLPEADTAELTQEIAYFQSETAAQRYLGAATGAGEAAEEADQRLSQLQARVWPVPAAAQSESTAPLEPTPAGDAGADGDPALRSTDTLLDNNV